jgi:hypothetical protein
MASLIWLISGGFHHVLKGEFPGFRDEVLAETVVWLFEDARETGGLIEMTRGE